MREQTKKEILEKMEAIRSIARDAINQEEQKIGDTKYYKDLNLGQVGIENAYVVEIENIEKNKEIGEREVYVIYKIYTEDHVLVANVDNKGDVEFSPEFLEQLKQISPEYFESLNLEDNDTNFELPEEKEDEKVISYKEEEEKENAESSSLEEKIPEEDNETQEIAKQKGIPACNVLIVRNDSNFYKDHPEVERNLYFYRSEDGVIKAEYIDENGISQPSKYFEPSTTSIRQETISMGANGNPVKKEVPYQTMITKLQTNDKDIRSVRINIDINCGYLEISESRQGVNGQWASHEIECRGKDYNSAELNKATSTKYGVADPAKDTSTFAKVEQTSLENDGVQYSEMQKYAESLVEKFMDQGYNKEESIKICNYMIGEEQLKEDEAKTKVNEEIKDNNRKKDTDYGENDEDGRTPGGDAWERRENRGMFS